MSPKSRRARPSPEQLEDRSVPATVQTFDGGGSTFVTKQHGVAPGPALVAGPTGNAMRLASATAGTIGSITFPVTDPGKFPTVQADLDIRMTPGVGRADGIGVAFLNTADAEYGSAPFVGGGSEEPNFRQSLGVGFDIYQSAGEPSKNTVSLHFNEQKLTDVDVPLDLASGSFFHARIVARFGTTAGGGDVTVQVGPAGGETTVLNQFAVPGLLPYQSRFHAMARSGGESADHDIDNVNVQYIPDTAPPTISFVSQSHSVIESQPAVVLRAVRTGNSQGEVSVTVNTANGTATAGQDFTGGPFTLTFAAGQTEKDVAIPLVNDAVAEPVETMTATLSNPTNGATLGAPATATVTINDDDAAPPGTWGPVIPLPVTAIHTVMLPNGEVMFWSRHDMGQHGAPHVFNPTTGASRMVGDPGYDIFCAGHVVLPDGRVFVAGGHITDGAGEKKASIYDWRTDTWARLDDMNAGRWYPSVTLLPGGDVLVLGGTFKTDPNDKNEQPQVNPLPQVFQMKTNTWRSLTDAPQGNYPAWADFYPWAAVAPDGRVFVAGPQQTARFLDTSGTGKWTDAGASALAYRDYGSAVEYADGRILITGGNPREDPNVVPQTVVPSASAQTIDMTAATPTFQTVAPMTFGRRHHNLVLLPDGTVLAVGGSSTPGFQDLGGAVYTPEIWNPATNTWTPQAKHSIPLLYHSNALLLPTGEVLITGGGQPAPPGGVDQKNAQLFSPAYLFNGPRPTIQSAPGAIAYNRSFTLRTSDPVAIAKVVLIPLPSPTHAFNQNQGVGNLTFTRTATGLTVTAPADGFASAPGYYYLFAVSDAGVPSVAAVVRLTDAAVAIVETAGATAVAEGGATDTYSLVLTAQPTADVTVTVTSQNPATGATVTVASLTFTPANWNQPQTVTVAAADDVLVEGAQLVTIVHAVASADARYDSLDAGSVTVAVADNDQPSPVRTVAVGPDAGGGPVVKVYNADGTERGAREVFDSKFRGGVRTATADFNGDGTPDVAVGTGPGTATLVRVLDGVNGSLLFEIAPFEPTFTGGVFVAVGDLNGDGRPDLVITPDEGGGPRARVFSGNGFAQLADFFGIEDVAFRGGARAAVGDVTGDGIGDLLVAAGFGGGPRLAVWDGSSLVNGRYTTKPFGDFFVFELSLRNGVYVAAGDLDGDTFADVIAGGGPGGGPRVFALSGKGLVANQQTQLANFFAGDTSSTGGIRVAATNLDGDARADLVVGAGTKAGSRVTAYAGSAIPVQGQPIERFAFEAFPGFAGGVFVG
jgi:hypothetical protein